jgi:hypothetical protein
MLLSDSIAETLIKINQFDLLKYYADHQRIVKKYWLQIKTCIRNNYLIEDPSIWFDHLKLLEEFKKDNHNPKYICSPTLKRDHQELIREKQRLIEKKWKEDKERIERENKLFRKQKKNLLNLRFSDGVIDVVVLKTITDFKKEGKILEHCVYSSGYHKKDDSLIMSARLKEERLETIEISLRDMKIEQCRGYQNEDSPYHNEIINLVNSNINTIKKLIKVE